MKVLSNEYYLESAPITKSIIHLSIPMMIGISLSTIYNVINIFFIGLLKDTQMITAVTLGLPISTILMAFGSMLGIGGGTFITRLVAKKKIEEAKYIAGYVFYTSIMVAILIAAAALLMINPIVNILGVDVSTIVYTKNYTLTMFFGGFSTIINFALEQIVRGEGASKESMKGMIIGVVLNFIFDPIFILALKLNVVGAALAIILANLGSCIYYAYYLEKKSEHLRQFIYCFQISLRDKIEIYKIGISRLLMSVFLIVTTLLLNNYSIEYGDNVVAGFGIALRITQVPEFLSMGLYLGIIPLIAYNFSNKNFTRLKSGVRQSALWIGILSVVFGILVYTFKLPIIGLFSSDYSVIGIGGYIMTVMLVSTLFNGFTGLFTGIFQASGQGIPTTIMSVTQGILYIPVIIILHDLFGLYGVIWSMTVTEVITFIMGLILYINFNNNIKKSGL